MNAVAYILTRKPEADAAYLNAQGVPISVKDNVDGTRFLALTVPNGHLPGHLHYLNPGDAMSGTPTSSRSPPLSYQSRLSRPSRGISHRARSSVDER